MGQKNKSASGSVYDTYTTESNEYRQNRMPELGQVVDFEDGRKFVFASTLVDVAAGELVGSQGYEAGVTLSAANAREETMVINKVGAVTNAFADGMVIIDEVGGTAYKIKSSTATGAANAVILTLYEGLITPLEVSDSVLLLPPRNVNVVISTADNDTVGSAIVATTAATDGTTVFQWFQYEGIGVSVTSGILPGVAVMAADDGAILAQTAGNPIVGRIVAEDDNNLTSVYWTIEGG
jgi:hypothetical protein